MTKIAYVVSKERTAYEGFTPIRVFKRHYDAEAYIKRQGESYGHVLRITRTEFNNGSLEWHYRVFLEGKDAYIRFLVSCVYMD